jgi:hypothetical protein
MLKRFRIIIRWVNWISKTRALLISCFVEGNSLRSASRMTAYKKKSA